jgi:NitT/TauT family transport system substrate-binding protein
MMRFDISKFVFCNIDWATRQRLRDIVAGIVAVMAVAVWAPAVVAQDKVTVRTDWFHSSYHSPFFVGIEKGFYRVAGIDLKPTEGRGSGQVVQLVGKGDDQFGFASTDAVFRAVAKGIPVVAVANVMPKMGQAMFVMKRSGITKPEQLKGKLIGVTPGGTNETLLPAFLENVGLSMSDVKQVAVSPASKVRMFLQGQFDAIMATAWAAGLFAQDGGANVFVYSDYGVSMVGFNIVTNPNLAKSNADLVKRFIAATMKSWAYAKANPEEALDALAKHSASNAKPGRRARNSGDLATAMKYVGNAVPGKPMGFQSERDWLATQALLLKWGVVKELKPITTYFTNAYIGQ